MRHPKYKLDKEEREVLKAFDEGRLKRVPDFQAQKKMLQEAAINTLAKNRNINLRISEQDLYRVKSIAARQGIPYQTLLSSLIHQYSNHNIDYNVLKDPRGDYGAED